MGEAWPKQMPPPPHDEPVGRRIPIGVPPDQSGRSETDFGGDIPGGPGGSPPGSGTSTRTASTRAKVLSVSEPPALSRATNLPSLTTYLPKVLSLMPRAAQVDSMRESKWVIGFMHRL